MELSRENLAKILPKDAVDTIFGLHERAMRHSSAAAAQQVQPQTTVVVGTSGPRTVSWDDITDKPATFPSQSPQIPGLSQTIVSMSDSIINLDKSVTLLQTEASKTKVFRLSVSGLTTGWLKIGTIDSANLRIQEMMIAMLASPAGKAAPSQYRLTCSANPDGGSGGACYFGAQLTCVLGEPPETAGDGVLLGIAMVRRAGYSANKADVLLHFQGSEFISTFSIIDPDDSFEWGVVTELSDPGTGDDVTVAIRRFLYAV